MANRRAQRPAVRGGRIGNERPWRVFGPWIDGKDVRTFGYEDAALGAAFSLAQSLPVGEQVWVRHREESWVTLTRCPARKVEATLHWIRGVSL